MAMNRIRRQHVPATITPSSASGKEPVDRLDESPADARSAGNVRSRGSRGTSRRDSVQLARERGWRRLIERAHHHHHRVADGPAPARSRALPARGTRCGSTPDPPSPTRACVLQRSPDGRDERSGTFADCDIERAGHAFLRDLAARFRSGSFASSGNAASASATTSRSNAVPCRRERNGYEAAEAIAEDIGLRRQRSAAISPAMRSA